MQVSKQLIDAGRGITEIDLVLQNANLVNVLSGEIHQTDIGIHQGKFVGIGRFEHAIRKLDLQGKYVAPGLIDSHVHVESSCLCPEEFVAILLAHGVTSAVIDPHEIANVMGSEGIKYMLNSLSRLPFNAFIALPSCVPATKLETSGARIEAEELKEFLDNPMVIGLGEVMNFPGVLEGDPALLAKLELSLNNRDGHAPGIAPQDLNALYLAGISNDHECSTPEEAIERLRRGYYVMLREGSAAKNLLDLLPAVNAENSPRFLMVTDDRHPAELLTEGSIDHLVRLAINSGQPPLRVIQMATINAAQAYGLKQLGAVAPGFWADFVVLNDLQLFDIEAVYRRGALVSSLGKRPVFPRTEINRLRNSVKLHEWRESKLAVPGKAGTNKASVRVIGVQGHSLVTRSLIRELPVLEGKVLADKEQKIAKLAIVERHKASGRVGIGFVQGLDLVKGAIASSIAHDSHNIVAVGMNDCDLDLAIRTCAGMGGGICLIEGEKVLGRLPLPIAGLMSERSATEVSETLKELHAKARTLGISNQVDPFMTLAFLSLPVIPEIKLTDLGLVDVINSRIISVLVD